MKVLVSGAGGFIGGFLVKSLIQNGHQVTAVDIKDKAKWLQIFNDSNNIQADMRLRENWMELSKNIDRIYNLACNMGGMGFIQNNHALCMESVLIQAHALVSAKENGVPEILYSSSACVYPLELQDVVKNSLSQGLREKDAIPANPEDGYGWEKLFSEIMTKYFSRDFEIDSRVCRYHNVYGPFGTWKGGREKAPAAICRKVIEAKISGSNEIEIWGDGKQTRSFMYIDDCITGMDLIWAKGDSEPLNLGSDEMVSINQLVDIVENIAGTKLKRIYNTNAPTGVRGRNSNNDLIKSKIGWAPSITLEKGIEKTYKWIYEQLTK